jgi:hypothetical protein
MASLDVGSTGPLVKILQSCLKVLNFYQGEISGTFDDDTQEAVEQFQAEADITDKEGVDENTWTALVERFEPIWNQGDREFKQLLEKVIAAQNLAESAKTAAETAKSGAETAKTGAESAKMAAETAKSGAESAKTAAETAKSGAETAKTGAETAKTAAETAKAGAETAKTGAESAKTAAETAKSGAETAMSSAESAKTAAETAKTEAESAKTAAETAKTEAESAKTAAETAKTEAETVQGEAERAAFRANASACAVRAREAARRAALLEKDAIASYNRIKEMKAAIENSSTSAQQSAADAATTKSSSIAQASDNAAKAAKAKEQEAQTELDKATAALSQAQEQAKAADLAALEAEAQEKQALDATEITGVKTAVQETATQELAAKAAEIEVSKALAIVQAAETTITPMKAEVEKLAEDAAKGLPPDKPIVPTPVEPPNWQALWKLFSEKTEISAPLNPDRSVQPELPLALTNWDEFEYLFELKKPASTSGSNKTDSAPQKPEKEEVSQTAVASGGKVKEASEQVTEG